MDTLTLALIGVIAVLLIALVVSLVTRPKVVTLSDDLPKGNVTRTAVMKLQNEIAPYVFIKDNKVCLKVVK